MKIKITFKDTDALEECIKDSLEDLVIEGLSEEEMNSIKETRKLEILELSSKWFEYGEYINLEIDTEEKTCIVLENK